ncbi:molybdopterin-binding/glycosyltransferase family 2 protein [Kiloniella laminariae]|uniref:Molybdopterin-binding/glycosyltransferase family 2 protein n=1 Tax=Kiloniella laminariae TaxID=454162 RepID=A0ABT4LJZ1_9PROT|nr:molybdopterin-binding/glycosyltransferase family 2 protein [Kiloniella laminariae]MCZ4281422.1 molybdopterin-binding/glycosyltransferase family 2 protein [Kiloniella laminariae]
MIFAEIETKAAVGTYLSHSIKIAEGRLSKGHKLTETDLHNLVRAGHHKVTTLRLEAGDLHEDIAAAQLARAVSQENITVKEAFTGRCNLYSAVHGLLIAKPDEVNQLNGIDEAITIATLPPFTVVYPGQMVATAKIIPLSAPARSVELAGQAARLSVAPFRKKQIGLILTRLPQSKDSVLEKTRQVVAQRLQSCDNDLQTCLITDHKTDAIASAIQELRNRDHDLILVFGASAITDRRDSLPAGLEKAGGKILHFGMPVDPGNLLLLGEHSGVPVIGLPGCARSPKLNGFDWILQRCLADIKVTANDLTSLGCGGLLSEIVTRPQPRERISQSNNLSDISSLPAYKITALLLAGGQSRRMGKLNKLLQLWQGKPMVQWVVDSLEQSTVDNIIVVTGYDAEKIRAELADDKLDFVHNPDFAEGLSTSLISGLKAVPADSDAVLVCLGDMPLISKDQINQLISVFDPENSAAICIPTFIGKRGNPVLWSRQFIPEMITIKGDNGARHLLGNYASDIREVPMDTDAILSDIDTPEALKNLREKFTEKLTGKIMTKICEDPGDAG